MSNPSKEMPLPVDINPVSLMDIAANSEDRMPQELMLLYHDINQLLVQIGYWDILRKQCHQYSIKIRKGQIQDMYRFEVVVELSSVCELSCVLATKIIYEFKAITLLFENVIFNKIKFWDLIEDISREQMYAVLRMQGHGLNLPFLNERDLSAAQSNQLIFYQGLVDSASKPITYLQSTRYECGNPNCQITYYKRVHFTISENSNQPSYRCAFCNSQMMENKNWRILGEKVLLNSKCLKPLHEDGPAINRPSLLCCRDELIKEVKLARRYTFIGFIAFYFIQSKYVAVFEVQSMMLIIDFPSMPMSMGNLTLLKDIYTAFMEQTEDENNNMCSIIPANKQTITEPPTLLINFLYPDLNISSWQFVFNLAKTFASVIVPDETYFGLKLIMLLTMAQTTSEEELTAPISLCISASDTVLVNRIFKYATIFCPYAIHHSNTLQLFPNSTVVEYNKASVNVGSFLWTNYIYIFNNLETCSFSKNDFTLLTNVLENGKITLDFGSGHDYFKDCISSLASSIWASVQKENTKLKMFDKSSKISSYSAKEQKVEQLINSFNLMFHLDAWDLESAAVILSGHSLFCTSSGKTRNSTFSTAKWIEYFDSVRKWNVCMAEEAKELIHKYYIKRRSFSQENGSLASFPSSLMQTLITLSTSFAKLAFAIAVDVSHVIIAILLVEENLLARTGLASPFASLIKQDLTVKVTYLFYEPQSEENMKMYENEILDFVYHS